MTHELEPQAELVGPEERGLHGPRRQSEDLSGNGNGLIGGARPVTDAAGDVAAREDRDTRSSGREELACGLDADTHECDIAAHLASARHHPGRSRSRSRRCAP